MREEHKKSSWQKLSHGFNESTSPWKLNCSQNMGELMVQFVLTLDFWRPCYSRRLSSPLLLLMRWLSSSWDNAPGEHSFEMNGPSVMNLHKADWLLLIDIQGLSPWPPHVICSPKKLYCDVASSDVDSLLTPNVFGLWVVHTCQFHVELGQECRPWNSKHGDPLRPIGFNRYGQALNPDLETIYNLYTVSTYDRKNMKKLTKMADLVLSRIFPAVMHHLGIWELPDPSTDDCSKTSKLEVSPSSQL